MTNWVVTAVLFIALLLSGCSSTPSGQTAASDNAGSDQALTTSANATNSSDSPNLEHREHGTQTTTDPIDVYDPWEGFNRSIYDFNARFDKHVFLPVVDGYRAVVHEWYRDRVSSFFSNLTEISTVANSLLQGKLKRAGKAAFRFVFNSTIGLFGFFDPVGGIGIPQVREDFGQTLGAWGVGDGPYLVLPFFGPSNLRDTTGLAADFAAHQVVDPFGLASFETDHPEMTAAKIVDKRHTIGFRYYQTGSPFEYELVRLLYTRIRLLEIEK